MAKGGGLGQQFYIGGYDISGDVASIQTASSTRGVLDKTGINSSAIERVLTHGSGEITFQTHFNDATGQEHDALSGLPTGQTDVMWLTSSSRGDEAAFLQCKQVGYDWDRGTDGNLLGTVQCLGDAAPLEWGVMVTAGTDTHASATSSSSVDENGATGDSSNGARGYIQVMSIDSGTPTFILEDSSNDSVWATLISFGADTARSSDRLTVTGAVGRYVRATTTGTFTNATFAMGFQRGTAADIEDLS